MLKIAIDITEAQKTKLEAQYQLEAIDRSTGIIEFATDGTILGANNQLLERFGYRPDDVIGQHHRILCPPGYDGREEYQVFWTNLREGQYQSGIFRRVSVDGQRIWISASYNPIFDSQGRVSRIIKFAQDITESYEATLFSQQQIEALKSAQAVLEFDKDGIVRDASQAFFKRTGFDRDMVIGRPFGELFWQGVRGAGENADAWDAIVTQDAQSSEWRGANRGNREMWWRASFHVIRDVDGDAMAVSMVAFDTTEEKLSANELIARDAAMNAAFIRIDFSMDGKVLGMNENALRFYGLDKPEDARNTHHNAFAPPDSEIAVAYEQLWAQLRKGELVSGRFRRMTRHGRQVWLEGAYSPIRDLSGQPIRVVAFGVDITEQMEIESHIEAGIGEINETIGRLAHHVRARRS